ncbi:MAG: tetratricopeptide repeat protein [Ferruginibacter sp.]
MFEISGKYDAASDYYAKVSRHTADPVMDIYARLNDAKMMRNTGLAELNTSIANLLRMAKKDRYEAFRDVIYYSAARLTLQRPDTASGIGFFTKSISYNSANSGYRDKSYLDLADIAYNQRRYRDAAAYYDSLKLSGSGAGYDSALIAERKEILGRLVPKLLIIEREDSLQLIAAMAPEDRVNYLKKMVKKYRKENGLKEEDDFGGNTLITFNDRNKAPVDLFKAAGANTGDWYFYNSSLRSKGFNEFKSKWGKRTNIDNWRRKTASEGLTGKNANTNIDIDATVPQDGKGLITNVSDQVPVLSYEGLMANLPLTQELLDTSNSTIASNLFDVAQIFQNELEDYERAVLTYENFIKRFPQDGRIPDVYYNLSFCWTKLGDPVKANYYKNLLQTNYAGTNAARLAVNPLALQPNTKSPEVTARYDAIYNMFIEGNFAQATAAKKKADSTYGVNYWSPQLLYIESVYYIKERNDSTAIAILENIPKLYAGSPLSPKATVLIDVLQRRAAIEKYLTDLQITRVSEEKIIISDDKPKVVAAPTVVQPAVVKATAPVLQKRATADSVKVPDAFVNKSFVLQPDKPHFVVMILEKVDGVYVNEAKNAFGRFNKESMATINVAIARDVFDADRSLLVFTAFDNSTEALKYFDRIKKAAPKEISWLQPSKYSFIIISDNNLQLLKTNKDLTSYRQLINANFGNRF